MSEVDAIEASEAEIGAASALAAHTYRARVRRIGSWMPVFYVLLAFYIVVELLVDVRTTIVTIHLPHVAFSIGAYYMPHIEVWDAPWNLPYFLVWLGPPKLMWIELFYIFAVVSVFVELLRVSIPGEDNTTEAGRLQNVFMIYLVLFGVGTALDYVGYPVLRIFSTSEFFVLTVIAYFQQKIAYKINARTLKRTIDNTQGDHHHNS